MVLVFLVLVVLGLAAPARAARIAPNDSHLASTLKYPGAPKPVYNDTPPPYAMNYADEAAQTLGFKGGHMDVFSTHPAHDDGLMPSLSGGLGSDGAMIRLQWHPGE